MKLLILGAAGQISKMLTEKVLKETDLDIVLYARNATSRLKKSDVDRVEIYEGDFQDEVKLDRVMKGVDIIYLNDMNSPEATQKIIHAAEKNHVSKIIGATILGIYDEVPGEFGKWNARMVGGPGTKIHKNSAATVENSTIDYTLLRLTWLYNQNDNESYEISHKGEPFIGAQVTRQAVTRLIMNIIQNPELYKNESLGVVEPNTDFPKPSFY